MMHQFISHSTKETEAFAAQFAESLLPNTVVAYRGSMGMGKTAFTRGVMKGLGADDVVTSPTFALVNEYSSPKYTVYHFDMYRVTTWDDLIPPVSSIISIPVLSSLSNGAKISRALCPMIRFSFPLHRENAKTTELSA